MDRRPSKASPSARYKKTQNFMNQDRQASGRSNAEGGGGSLEGLPEGQREGFDQLLCGSLHHRWHGETDNNWSTVGMIISGSRRLFLSEISSVT